MVKFVYFFIYLNSSNFYVKRQLWRYHFKLKGQTRHTGLFTWQSAMLNTHDHHTSSACAHIFPPPPVENRKIESVSRVKPWQLCALPMRRTATVTFTASKDDLPLNQPLRFCCDPRHRHLFLCSVGRLWAGVKHHDSVHVKKGNESNGCLSAAAQLCD